MNRCKYKLVYLLSAVIFTASCSPSLYELAVDVRQPASVSIANIEDKSIAVYVTAEENSAVDDNASLPIRFASGLAAGLEKNLGLDEGAVYVYNHYPENGASPYAMDYIQSLSRQADSDMLILVENVQVSDFTLIDNVAVTAQSVQYMHALFEGNFSVYDGTTAELIAQKNIKDTVYWELLSNNSTTRSSRTGGVEVAVNSITSRIGDDVADIFFAKWKRESRYLYVYNSLWRSAFNYARAFEWDRAIAVWSAELTQKGGYKAACAAINIAVGCEMTGRADLALEWLNTAERMYNAEELGLESYKLRLRQTIEKGKKN